MNLIFATKGIYPDTHAAAIRHSLLAKGLVELGHSVTFLLLSSQMFQQIKFINYFGIIILELVHLSI